MRRGTRTALLLAPTLALGCLGNPDRQTLARLRNVEPDLAEVQIQDGLDQAMAAYKSYLRETPESSLTPEAMRRLADLKLEKEFGILGGQGAKKLPAPDTSAPDVRNRENREPVQPVASIADVSESLGDFERRAAGGERIASLHGDADLDLPGEEKVEWAGPEEAIELYDRILTTYPNYRFNDQVLYQKARAYDELGRNDEAIAVMERLISQYPTSRYLDEVQFRRGEYFFTRRKYLDAEDAYLAVVRMGDGSQYYELALYKLGWTFYKQELHEEALEQYIALLDHKVSQGYDFDQTEDEGSERRIADTFRVISLSFSSLGGSETVRSWFASNGHRTYEDRIYSHLGEFYLDKLRYHDAAKAYATFTDLYPLHRSSPHFSMRIVEIYEKGGFPKLVLESKKQFAATYGLQSEYWRHFDVAEAPEVLDYLRTNLEDLANHYHALYQDEEAVDDQDANFGEALRWYRAYLASFPTDTGTPAIHQRMADLLLENEDFGEAAREYERTAYDYPPHEKSAEAGYAAIYAHREHLKVADETRHDDVARATVASSLRFVDTFPEHEHSAQVLGAAVDDLYEMEDFETAIAMGRRLIEQYPDAELEVRRSAWAVVAHSSFDLGDYVQAEDAYAQVLAMTPEEADSRQDVVDNLAAAIYKQGEQARADGDFRLAADHFLRITDAAPTSAIRPAAEYDAGAALIHLEDWAAAAEVLESFRETHPDHELNREATKQIAFVQRKQGNVARAADEYERVAAEAEDPELGREALLLAGELYEEAEAPDRALDVYRRYVERFPKPLEAAVETRFKMASLHESRGDQGARQDQLRKIVEIDRVAGDERTDRIRVLAGRSALVLTEILFHRFEAIELTQPFDRSLREKKKRMGAALAGFEALVDYEVADVTAAATYYIAEIYSDFSRSLMQSERPADLAGSELLDYEMVLEEEAFPFEERAIAVHEKNLELMSGGVFNDWIQKSLDRLAVLMPGRYAKFEASSGLIASLDRYAYRVPGAPDPTLPDASGSDARPTSSGPEAAPESPVAADDMPAPTPETATETDPTADPVPAAPDPGAAEPTTGEDANADAAAAS